jgi:hypothetical protein
MLKRDIFGMPHRAARSRSRMATLAVEGAELVIRLTWPEKLGSMRGNVRVPLSAVRSVTVEDRPWGLIRGVRAAGTGVAGVIALGVRRYSHARDFAVVYGNRPVVRIELGEDSPFARLLIRVASPEHAAAMITPAGGGRSA